MLSLLRQLLILALLTGAAAWALDRYGPGAGEDAAETRRARPPAAVEAATAESTRIERSVSAVGTGRARRSVELRAAAPGRVQDIAFTPGATVKKGDALVRLDSAPQAAALAEAEAELEEARAAFDRASALAEQGRVTGQAFEAARADLLRAEARLERARVDLDERVVRAPFDGVIGLTDLAEGALVGRDVAIATLQDLSVLQVAFSVPERFFADVAVGDPVRVETTIFPGRFFEGRVTAVEPRVDEVTRAFRVRAEARNPGLALPSGLFLRVTLVFDSIDGVAVPEDAVIVSGGGAHVFVIGEGDVIERRAITVGRRWNGRVEAADGLAAGERVVTRGIQKVRDGATVRVIAPDAPRADGAVAAPTAAAGQRGGEGASRS
ncbi:efflux RND transporter periplasmic adaptor subunit [Rhodovulum sp. DZ06]|uniref:efflux RND transporter periplasmic adaptor subunit n=1 Tax=Rhodovulum sp. DZ06 TaxID=3425126 RepID=UPI003D34DB25